MNKLATVLNWVDWGILFIAFRFLYKGFKNGLQKTLFDTLRMILVLFCSLTYFLYLADLIQKDTLIPLTYAKLISFVGLAFLSYLVVWACAFALSKVINISFTSWIDKSGGLLGGLIHYFFVVGFILLSLMLVPIDFTHKQVYERSFLGKRMVRVLVHQVGKWMKWAPGPVKRPTVSDFGKPLLPSPR